MDDLPILKEIENQKTRGVFLVLTGPSGSGKDAVLKKLQANNPDMQKIITTTSRQLRESESEGHPYHFITRLEFEDLIAKDEFFEWVEFRGELYGTQKKTINEALESGKDIIWKIEAKGVKNSRDKMKSLVPRIVYVFLTTPSLEMMRKRVEEDEGIEGATKRFNEALVIWEMRQFKDCDYLVVNSDSNLEVTVQRVEAIIKAKRMEILG